MSIGAILPPPGLLLRSRFVFCSAVVVVLALT